MALNRKQRRDTAIKGKTYYGELRHQVMIADLRVYVNKEVPDGVMIVSEAEGDRLQALVDEATSKAVTKAVEDHKTDLEEEAKHSKELTIERAIDLIAGITSAGGTVTPEDYAIYAKPDVVFVGKRSDYPLEIITSDTNLPDGVSVIVAKREGK